uniref:Purple acid phosphatase n=1 Tax=Rhizophora mucronata TaxID=61149 RepID=A0A2P2JKJ1_RHIMU
MVQRERDFAFAVALVLGLILIVAEVCRGGITSSYARNDDLSLDMPLDSDVFRVPPGYNAPQQVRFCWVTQVHFYKCNMLSSFLMGSSLLVLLHCFKIR